MEFKQAIFDMYRSGVLYGFAFAVGASVGSFLNVVIYRWPLELSIVKPGSHCPSCRRPIPWYLNVPVLSWLMLRGRCRFCGARISARYFLVELGLGLWAVLGLWRFGPGLPSLACLVFGAALVAGSIIDLDHRLLPDVITAGTIPLGIIMAFLPRTWVGPWPVDWVEALVGLAIGAGLFQLVLMVFKYATGKEGMGRGDVKLMGSIGAFLGYQAIPAVIFIASAAGIGSWLVLAAMKKADRNYALPFGPFLSAAALIVIMLRPWLQKYWIIIEWV
ncbi:MAG TPA: prepilin peptidase [bacterium]|nr:prepilin peptidase [bacterium]